MFFERSASRAVTPSRSDSAAIVIDVNGTVVHLIGVERAVP